MLNKRDPIDWLYAKDFSCIYHKVYNIHMVLTFKFYEFFCMKQAGVHRLNFKIYLSNFDCTKPKYKELKLILYI